jgi:hypothetical protein
VKRFLGVIIAASLALPAYATCGWVKGKTPISSVATCTTGTEAASQLTATSGISLVGVGGFSVHVETASNMTAAGKLLAYLLNPETGNWLPVSDGSLDLTVAAVTGQAWSGFTVSGPYSRIAYVPSGVGGANPLKVYIVGVAFTR